ncbi:peptide-methionine (S)-S-oxide reductase [Novosphingobium sp. PC22D]|uniref:peptide-methionine (S)-S-oxide reductase MsrA n=1 Tax=Novosphingobium sp. PC22D TaxID=1962403 RepID=UPI000BF1575A|nr:peptide-methionine (S)-S-oxide reductase MsrA [Novosphingobium sp. PC22D]PEQ12306.1 peptide-methionine (S)-S-oxide reductase [Novosphingobium sp. PC22D]
MNRPGAILLAGAALLSACQAPVAAESIVRAPIAEVKASETGKQTAIFAGGCFWGIEGVFSHVKGVSSAVSGYHGDTSRVADYQSVSSGKTRHAEAVRVRYDPSVIRYDQLLRIFFSVGADPTQLDRQGPDHGSQYRSALVPTTAEQAKVAKAYLDQIGKSGLWKAPIVTRIESYRGFFPAETYHQDFMLNNPRNAYIERWDAPKVAGLKALYPVVYKAEFTRD